MQVAKEIKAGSLVKHLRIGFVGIAKDICTATNSARVEILDNIIDKEKNEDFKYFKERHILGQEYTALLGNLEVVKTTLMEDVVEEEVEDVEDSYTPAVTVTTKDSTITFSKYEDFEKLVKVYQLY